MRMLYPIILALSSLIPWSISLYAAENAIVELAEDSTPLSSIREKGPHVDDQTQRIFLETYLQGVLDTKFPQASVKVQIRRSEILLTDLPENKKKREAIVQFVTNLCSTPKSQKNKIANKKVQPDYLLEDKMRLKGDVLGFWLPQATILFPTQIANPRQICFSGGFRFGDKCIGKLGSEIVLGDQFPIYRWCEVGETNADMQLDIEAGVFGIFNHDSSSSSFINGDYYVGIPLSYAVDSWAFRARLYHISSHLGDEYMVHCHRTLHTRKNKSFEAVDFFADRQINKNLRLYGGLGAIFHSDSEMRLKPFYAEYGGELRAFRYNFEQVYGQPFFAAHFRNYQQNHYKLDSTCALGYEFGKIQGIGKKVRVFLEYHDGFSCDGQFSNKRCHFFSIRLAYGF